MPLMTQAEYSRHRGVSRKTITKYAQRGLLDGAFRSKGGKRLIVSAKADRLLGERLDPRQDDQRAVRPAPRSPDNGGAQVQIDGAITFAGARAQKEYYQALTAKLNYEVDVGTYVLASEVDKIVFDISRIVRDRILAIPDRVSDLLAAEEDPVEARRILTEEVHDSLTDLAELLTTANKAAAASRQK